MRLPIIARCSPLGREVQLNLGAGIAPHQPSATKGKPECATLQSREQPIAVVVTPLLRTL